MATAHVSENVWTAHFSSTIGVGAQMVNVELEVVVEELVYAASIYGFLDALGFDSVEARALLEEKASLFLRMINYRYSEKIFKYLYSQRRWLPNIVDEYGEEMAKMLLYTVAVAANSTSTCTSDVENSIDWLLTLLAGEEPKDLSCIEKAYLAALLLTTPPPEAIAT